MEQVSSAAASTKFLCCKRCPRLRTGDCVSDDTTRVGVGRCPVVWIPVKERWQDAKGEDCSKKMGKKNVSKIDETQWSYLCGTMSRKL